MKEAVLQVRMESELKSAAEDLYKELGTSFAEMVRVMAKKSVEERQLPFRIIKLNAPKGFGVLNKYATEKTAKMSFDDMKKIAIKKHVVEKYGKIS